MIIRNRCSKFSLLHVHICVWFIIQKFLHVKAISIIKSIVPLDPEMAKSRRIIT